MKNTMKLHTLSKDFAQTKTGENFAAEIENRVVRAREAEIPFTSNIFSNSTPHWTGRAA